MNYRCPCCGYYTYPVSIKSAAGFICPICFWENDLFIYTDFQKSTSNHNLTLREARENFESFGASEIGMVQYVREPFEDERSGYDFDRIYFEDKFKISLKDKTYFINKYERRLKGKRKQIKKYK